MMRVNERIEQHKINSNNMASITTIEQVDDRFDLGYYINDRNTSQGKPQRFWAWALELKNLHTEHFSKSPNKPSQSKYHTHEELIKVANEILEKHETSTN